MSLDVNIAGRGSTNTAAVSSNGQLIVSSYDYESTSATEMAIAATAYNYIEPKPGYQAVITGGILAASKNVSATTEADIEFYEAVSIGDNTVAKSLIQLTLLKQQQIGLGQRNILVNHGVWVNGKTSDAEIKVTLFYYYVPVIS